MMKDLLNSGGSLAGWRQIVSTLSDEFINHVLTERPVEAEMEPFVKSELQMYLGLLMGSKLNEGFSERIALDVIKYYMLRVHENAKLLGFSYHQIMKMTSERHDFFIDGLFDSENSEDFLRTTAMQWFQFPLLEVDGGIRPNEYDFSVYFSDNYVVSDILFKLAPSYVNAIIAELKLEAPSFMLN